MSGVDFIHSRESGTARARDQPETRVRAGGTRRQVSASLAKARGRGFLLFVSSSLPLVED